MLDSLSHMSGFFSLLGYLPQCLMWAVIFLLWFINSRVGHKCVFQIDFFITQGAPPAKFIYEKISRYERVERNMTITYVYLFRVYN